MIFAALIYATQLLAGWLIWSVLTKQQVTTLRLVPRALLLGPAAITLQMLAYSVLAVPFALWSILIPWWLLGGLYAARRRPGFVPRVDRTTLFAAVIVLVQFVILLAVVASAPVHISDAAHNFAVPARAIATHGGFSIAALEALVDPGNVHYPPLLLCNEALFFLIEPERGATLLQPMFALGWLAWAMLVVEALWSDRRRAVTLCLVVVVLATPEVVANAVHGLADVRLMGALLLTLLEWQRTRSETSGTAAIVLAALAAALTKREGYLIAACVTTWLLVRGCRARSGTTTIWALGLAAFAGAWPVFANLSGLAAIPAEFHPQVTLATTAEALTAVPATLLGLFETMVATDVEGHSRFGLFWPAAIVFVGWRTAQGRQSRRFVLWSVVHLLVGAHALAVITVGLQIEVEWVLRATAERVVLPLMVWMVMASANAPSQSPA